MPPFDREAALKAAEKALKLGKVDAAIAEYVKVVEAQPRDWNSANTLGDLFVRAKQLEKGLEQYTRIADHLAEEGFYPKASALYKKILKLQPGAELRRRALAQLMRIESEGKDISKLVDVYEKFGQAGSVAEVQQYRAYLAYQRQEFEVARRLLEGARAEGGTELMRRVYLASSQLRCGAPESALATLEPVRPNLLPEPWRGESEWTRLVEAGKNFLVGTRPEGIVRMARSLIESPELRRRVARRKAPLPFGATRRIMKVLFKAA